jgi:hypothetical protein
MQHAAMRGRPVNPTKGGERPTVKEPYYSTVYCTVPSKCSFACAFFLPSRLPVSDFLPSTTGTKSALRKILNPSPGNKEGRVVWLAS